MNMGATKDLSPETVAQIIVLKQYSHTAKETSEQIGVCS